VEKQATILGKPPGNALSAFFYWLKAWVTIMAISIQTPPQLGLDCSSKTGRSQTTYIRLFSD
jgi:hypothetical protein